MSDLNDVDGREHLSMLMCQQHVASCSAFSSMPSSMGILVWTLVCSTSTFVQLFNSTAAYRCYIPNFLNHFRLMKSKILPTIGSTVKHV